MPEDIQRPYEHTAPLRVLCRRDIRDRDDVIPIDPVSQTEEERGDKESERDTSRRIHESSVLQKNGGGLRNLDRISGVHVRISGVHVEIRNPKSDQYLRSGNNAFR